MSSIRSTQIRLYLEQCPHALNLYAEECDDKSIYAAGVAAHDIAHAVGIYPDQDPEDVARVVVNRLIEVGRLGLDAEGPIAPDAAFAGRDIFLGWLYNGGDHRPHPGAKYEHGMGFVVTENGAHWEPTEYTDAAATFRVRPDVVYPITLSGDDGFGMGLVARDYKTAWNAGDHTLDTIQLRSQAVAVWHARREFMTMTPDFIRREVVNLRTGAVHHADTWMDGAGRAIIDRWGRDILTTIKGIRKGRRDPRVGVHCYRCPFLAHCDALKASGFGADAITDPVELAAEYVLMEAWRKELQKRLREVTDERPVVVNETTEVGFVGKPTRVPADDVHARVWESWTSDVELDSAAHSTARGALHALKLGKTQLENIAKALFPDGDDRKAKRAAWLEEMTKPVIARRFGVWSKK